MAGDSASNRKKVIRAGSESLTRDVNPWGETFTFQTELQAQINDADYPGLRTAAIASQGDADTWWAGTAHAGLYSGLDGDTKAEWRRGAQKCATLSGAVHPFAKASHHVFLAAEYDDYHDAAVTSQGAFDTLWAGEATITADWYAALGSGVKANFRALAVATEP